MKKIYLFLVLLISHVSITYAQAPVNDCANNPTIISSCGVTFSVSQAQMALATADAGCLAGGSCPIPQPGQDLYQNFDCDATTAPSSGSGSDWTGTVENSLFWAFTSTVSCTYTITVTANNCCCADKGGTDAAQFQIFSITAPLPGGTINSYVSGNNAFIGAQTKTLAVVANQQYIIAVDGLEGSDCDILVSVTPAAGCGCAVVSPCTAPVLTITPTTQTICSTNSTSVTLTSSLPGTTYAWTVTQTGVSGASAGTGSVISQALSTTGASSGTVVYNVTPTTGTCVGTAKTVTITVNPTPTLTTSGTNSVCPGLTTTLTASGGSTYTWSPSSTLSSATGSLVVSTPTADVTYTISSTSAAGCTNTAVKSVSISPSPTVAITSSPTGSICLGSAISFTAATANTYTWSGPSGNGLSGTSGAIVSATPSVSGSLTYTVNASSAAGCTTTAVKTITVVANPTVAVNNATICNGVSAILTASNATSYLWNPGGAVTASISITPTITSFYTVTGTTAGCSDIKTATVTVNSIPTTSAITNGTINCTTPTISLTSTLSGMSYTWTAPSGGSVTTANTQNTSAFGGPGTYSLLVQSVAGCTFATTTSVTQSTVAPSGFTAGSNQTLTCGNPSVTLTGSIGTPANSTLNWTGANVCGTPTTIVTSACGAGIYTLTATDPINGCTQIANVTVSPSAGSPSVTASIPSNSITCTNTVVTISVSTTVAAASYTWSGTGISTGNGTGTITVTQGGIFIYSVTAGGCTTSGNITVSTNTTAPTTTASASGMITCSTPTINLNSTLAGMSYTWTAPAGGSVGTANTQTTTAYGAQGTYTVKVLNSVNGCTYTATTAVTQNTTVPTTIASTAGTLTCVTPTVTLNSTLSSMTYTWTAPVGGGVTTSSTQATIANGAGIYSLTLVDLSNGCSYSITTSVTQNTAQPTGVSAGSNQTLTCPSNSVSLTGSVTTPTNATVNWTGANVCGTATTIVTSACTAGDYTLTVTDPLNGCKTESMVTVSPNAGPPTATISATALVVDCNNPVQSVTVTSTPSTDVTYVWDNAPTTLSADGSVATFTNAGSYIATVTNTLSNCATTVSVAVTANTVVPVTTVAVPDILTCSVISFDINSSLAGMSYTWTTPALTTENTETITVTTPGIYTLSVLDPGNGCTFTTTAAVTQNTTLATGLSAGPNQTLTCPSNSVTLTGSVATPTDALVNWNGPNVCSTATLLTASACAPGDYTLTVTDPSNSCVTSSIVTISPNAGAPVANITSSFLILDCNNPVQSVTVTSTPSTDVTYVWDNAPTTLSTDGSIATFTTGGSYIATVTNTLNSCATTVSVTLSVNNTVPTPTVTVSDILTCSVLSVDLNPNLSGMSYTWTTPASTTVNTESTTATTQGNYTLTVVNPANGCSTTTIVPVIQNTTQPTGVSAGSGQALTCPANLVTLSGSVTTPTDALVNWTGTNVCGTATTNVTSACAAGDYTFTVTDPSNGCSTASVVTISPNAGSPVLSISSSTLVLDCNNPVQSVTVTSTPSTDVTYVWDNAPTTLSPDGSIAAFATTNTYVATVTNTLSSCSETVQVIVTSDMTAPSISITPNQTLTCANPTAVISTTVSSSVTYTWTGTLLSGQGTGTVMVNQPDNYTVNITGANGCTNTAVSTVTTSPSTLLASISIPSTNSVITCQNSSVTLSVTVLPTDTYTYTWSSGGTGTGTTENVTAPIGYTVDVVNSSGCTTSATITVTDNIIPPGVIITNTNIAIPCGSSSITIGPAGPAISTATNVSYGWTTSGTGSILPGSAAVSTPTVGSAGQYEVTVMDIDNGCTSTGTVNVTSTGVTVGFTANPLSGTAPLLVNFTNQSTGTTINAWTFGDTNNNTAISTDASHTYTATGTYVVTLTSADAGGCNGTATVSIEVFESATLIVPNVFTPNGDNSNDHFKIISTGMKDLTCDIFNRWGTKIYTIKTINDSWDGSGSADGTYFFILDAKGIDGKEFKQQGFISLFR